MEQSERERERERLRDKEKRGILKQLNRYEIDRLKN